MENKELIKQYEKIKREIPREELQTFHTIATSMFAFAVLEDFDVIKDGVLKLLKEKEYVLALQTLQLLKDKDNPFDDKMEELLQKFKADYNGLLGLIFDEWKEEEKIK